MGRHPGDSWSGPQATLLTPAGRGAIAVVAVAGPDAGAAVTRCFVPRGPRPIAAWDGGFSGEQASVRVGRWCGPSPDAAEGTIAPEEVLVLQEATGVMEVHCHGGLAASERILRDLESIGCRRVDWREWSRNGEGDRIEWEACLALAASRGPKAAAILSHQLAGALSRRLAEIRQLLASGEAGRETARRLLQRLLDWGALGTRLTTPFRVVVTGAPNAGKSSLVNALAGYTRSLVDPHPGTTRDLVATRLVLGGWDCEVFDTAGLRSAADDAVERAGIEAAIAMASAADLILHVRDAASGADGAAGDIAAGGCGGNPPMVLHVLSKCDHEPPSAAASTPSIGEPSNGEAAGHGGSATVATSALTGLGIDRLARRVRLALVPREPPPGEPVPFTPRQLAEIDALLQDADSTAGGAT